MNDFPVRAKVLPQGFDMSVNSAVIPVIAVSPHGFQKLFPAQYNPLILGQLQEKIKPWAEDTGKGNQE